MKIISGGQTGADLAGLDWAIKNGIPHGGWCPKGRLNEEGVIPAAYQLSETKSPDYDVRTEKNVLDSDGTVIFSILPTLTGGSKLTAELAGRHNKPWIHIHQATEVPGEKLTQFIRKKQIETLNIAGPRTSTEPRIASFVQSVLDEAWASDHK